MTIKRPNARIMKSKMGLRGNAQLVAANANGDGGAKFAEAKLLQANAGNAVRLSGAGRGAVANAAANAAAANPQADGVNIGRIMQDANGNIVGAEAGFGKGTKKYDANQLQWVMSRGASGGSLSRQDQAVYDRMMYLKAEKAAQEKRAAEEKRALDLAHAEDERKRKLDAKEWDRQNRIRTKQAQDAQVAQEERANAEWDRRTKMEQDFRAEREFAKQMEQEEQAEQERIAKERDNGRTEDMTDDDYAQWMQMGGNKGRAVWDHTAEDKQWYEERRREINDKLNSGEFSEEEAAKATADLDSMYGNRKKRVSSKPNMPTTDAPSVSEDGKWYWDTSKQSADGRTGAWVPMPNEPKPTETPEEKNARVAQERKDKWLDSRISELLKMTKKEKGTGENEGSSIDVPMFTYDTAYQQAMKDMAIRFPSATPTPTPAPAPAHASNPQGGETPPPATPAPTNDPKKKWAQYAD